MKWCLRDPRASGTYYSDVLTCVYNNASHPLQDRYEFSLPPPTSRGMSMADWFRTLFWSNIVAGGHSTYGGASSWMPYANPCNATVCNGVRGYQDLVAAGVLKNGARDLPAISAFFRSPQGLPSVVGLTPNNALCGSNSTRTLCSASGAAMLLYARNGTNPAQPIRFTTPQGWGPVGAGVPRKAPSVACFDPVTARFERVSPTATGSATNSQVGWAVTCPKSLPPLLHSDRVIVVTRAAPAEDSPTGSPGPDAVDSVSGSDSMSSSPTMSPSVTSSASATTTGSGSGSVSATGSRTMSRSLSSTRTPRSRSPVPRSRSTSRTNLKT